MSTSVTLGFGWWIGSFHPQSALAPSAPVNTVAPVISGGISVGQTLTTTDGTWTGNPGPTITYEWLRNGVPISGATGQTYVIQVADVGQTIRSRVTATNASGSANATSSNSVTPIAGVPLLALEAGAGLFLLEGGAGRIKLEANT